MKKTYLLGLPLFNLILGIAFTIESIVYHAQAQNNPDMGPATLSTLIYMLLVYGGFILISMAYGGYLFSKWKGTWKHILCYSFLTFVFSAILSIAQEPTGFWFKSMYWILPSCEQTLGFFIGSLIALGRHN